MFVFGLSFLTNIAFSQPITIEMGGENNHYSNPIMNLEYQMPDSTVILHSDALDWRKQYQHHNRQNWFAIQGQGYRTLETFRQLDYQTSYLGLEVGQQQEKTPFISFGASVFSGYYSFFDTRTRKRDEPSQFRGRIDSFGSFHKNNISLQFRLGTTIRLRDALEQFPHSYLSFQYQHPSVITPWISADIGLAKDQDQLALTRIGGEESQYIALLGADWGEFWQEDFIITRWGLEHQLMLSPFSQHFRIRTDIAWFETIQIGFGCETAWLYENWSARWSLGYASWKTLDWRPHSFSFIVGWNSD